MTNREFYNLVISNGNNSEETISYAKSMLKKLDERNEKRANTPSKTQVANEPIKNRIVELLSNGASAKTATEIAELLEVTTQKASALCRQMVEDKRISKKEVKIPKKGKQFAYFIKVDEN